VKLIERDTTHGEGCWLACAAPEVDMRLSARFALVVLCSDVARAAAAAVLPAEIDPEHRIGPAYNQQSSPAVCFTGSDFLVTWRDGRAGAWMVGGAFVSARSGLVDSTNLLFPMLRDSPAVAHDGTNSWILSRGEHQAVRVSAAGRVLDAAPLQPLPQAVGSGTHCALAFGSSLGLAAYTPLAIWYCDPDPPPPPPPPPDSGVVRLGCRMSGGVYIARLGKDGTILDPSAVAIRTDAGASRPSLGCSGDGFLVAWGEWSAPDASAAILAMRLDPTGALLDSIPKLLASPERYWSLGSPRLLATPTGYWLVYEEGIGTYGGRLHALRLDHDAAVTGRVDLGAATWNLAGDAAFDAAALGDTVLVAWYTTASAVECLRFDAAGIVPNSQVELFATGSAPAVGAGDGTFLVAVSRSYGVTSGDEIAVKRLRATGQVLDASEVVVSRSVNAQIDMRVASADGGVFAVWADDWPSSPTIRSARLDGAASLPGPLVELSVAGGMWRSPAIAADDRGALVLWADRFDPWYGTSHLMVRRVDGSASLGPAFRMPGCELIGNDPIQVAWNGRRHLLVWSGGRLTPEGWIGGLACTRLERHGLPVDSVRVDSLAVPQAMQLVTAMPGDLLGHAVAACDGGWMAIWGQVMEVDQPRRVLAARLDSLGARRDAAALVVGETASMAGRPDVACSGDECLAVWAGGLDVYGAPDVFAARLGRDGTLLDARPIRLTDDAVSDREPRVVFDGVLYLIAWMRADSDGLQNAWWATLSPDGIVAEPPSLAAAGIVSPPALASLAGGAVLAGFSWLHPEWVVPRAAILAIPAAEQRLQAQVVSAAANPFRGSVRFDLTQPGSGSLLARVYDVRGRLVRTLFAGRAGPGIHPIVWDGRAAGGGRAAAGVYFVNIVSERVEATRKVVLVE
jgi:hypothetical protein